MLPSNIKELLGLDGLGLKDYEVISKLAEARSRNLKEVEFVTKDKDGKKKVIKITLKHLEPEGMIGGEVWGW